VGAQVPIGAGLGFFHKYNRKEGEATNVSIAFYGDGSANQGQIWEAANCAGLWGIPVIFACENNEYGMGTQVHRHSLITDYYKQGNKIPGIYIDGMDVLAVREGTRFAKNYASQGRPIYVEYKTYRYHGHSMSDPGITYRDRDEVNKMRSSRDCIEQVKARIIEAGWGTEDSMKALEKDIRAKVRAWRGRARAQESPFRKRSRPPPPPTTVSPIFCAFSAGDGSGRRSPQGHVAEAGTSLERHSHGGAAGIHSQPLWPVVCVESALA
jgi:pyruvate dehydrogenase E1 component alpha subunit